MSEEQEEEEEGIEVDIDDDNNHDLERIGSITSSEEEESSTQPVEIIKEEIVTVVENPNAEASLLSSPVASSSLMENEKEGIRIDNNSSGDDEDVYEQVKAQSIQLSRLTDLVESLQSQVKQLQETTRLGGHKATPERRSSGTSTKTRKKTITGRRRTRGSKKK